MSTDTTRPGPARPTEIVDRVVIRFAGDSGDGMQLTGSQFTATSATLGNDLATFPDYPAEIRAPAGTLPGVSGFQINFASEDVYTPGDSPDVLVAMNPAALKVNVGDLKPGGILVVNVDAFGKNDLRKAAYDVDPLEDGSLDGFRLIAVELTRLTRAALEETGLPTRTVDRCKNFFALGMMYYLYNRTLDVTLRWIERKFAAKPELVDANVRALKAGFAFCTATEVFQVTYEVPPAKLAPGKYRNIAGNQALALGLVAGAHRSGRMLFQGSYPITPASDLLHQLSQYKNHGVVTFQAEDEIAAIGAAIGASFAGSLAVTSTSGPGLALKSEFTSLAIMVELPLVIVDIQRGGPSTGLPTKTEQADLAMALHGRHGEAPCIVISARSPADCFEVAFEACRLTLETMTPVILLSDGFIANGSEPWRLPDLDALSEIAVRNRVDADDFQPYARDPRTLARPWAVPGSAGLEHRVGGLEKSDGAGNVSYDPLNHETMTRLRAEKVARVASTLPPQEIEGDPDGDLLVVAWGSTYGAVAAAVQTARRSGLRVGHVHLRYLNPLPSDLGTILGRYRKLLVPEINSGQLADVLRARYLVAVEQRNKMQGLPFKESEILERIEALCAADA